jgi:DNA-binding ferritin-like protein
MNWSFVAMQDDDFVEDTLDGLQKLKWLLALIRAQYWSYQHAHWVVRGDASYGNHLLFQRLYESVTEQVDTLAEKIVGMHGPEALDREEMVSMFAYWNERWDVVDCLHRRGLTSESDCQNVIKDTYDELKDSGELSLGMDDFLMAMASEHETNQYLLRQVLRNKRSMDNWVPVKGG